MRLRATLAEAGLETAEKHVHVPLGHEAVDTALRGGLVRGSLHEVFAAAGHEAAATGFMAGLAARLAGRKRILWIRQDFSALEFGELCATGLLELGLDPARLLLLRVADAAGGVRAASDALSCAALGAIVIEIPGQPKILDLVTSRRLALGAERDGVTILLLRFAAQPDASTAETRWCVRAKWSRAKEEGWGHPVFEADLVRNRHGRTGHWVMTWDCDDGVFRETADCGAVVSEAFDRPVAAASGGGTVQIFRAAV
jgi:protein ImuA